MPFLPSLLLFTTLLSSSATSGKSVNSSNPSCPSIHCGGVTISYPFYQPNRHHDHHCGYPFLAITCLNQTPALLLSGHPYPVKKINYPQNTLTLSFSNLVDPVCPVAPHGVDLKLNAAGSPLNYTIDDKVMRFYYNCSLYPPSVRDIECLQFRGKRSYGFVEGKVPEFDWGGYCESTVAVPVIGGVVGGGLKGGFRLKWKRESKCEMCEESGGFCEYGDNGGGNGSHVAFFCLCNDGRHFARCTGAAAISVRFKPNFLAIGGVVFGSVIIATTLFYLVHKKKIGILHNNKRGFTQIPQ